jgi:hypothetical protein
LAVAFSHEAEWLDSPRPPVAHKLYHGASTTGSRWYVLESQPDPRQGAAVLIGQLREARSLLELIPSFEDTRLEPLLRTSAKVCIRTLSVWMRPACPWRYGAQYAARLGKADGGDASSFLCRIGFCFCLGRTAGVERRAKSRQREAHASICSNCPWSLFAHPLPSLFLRSGPASRG